MEEELVQSFLSESQFKETSLSNETSEASNDVSTEAQATELSPVKRSPRLSCILFLLKTFGLGIIDAIQIQKVYRVWRKSSKAREAFSKIILFNGIISLGSLIIFQFFLLPFIKNLISNALLHENIPTYLKTVIYITSTISIYSIYFLWALPMWLLSFVINISWLNTISTEAFRQLLRKDPPGIEFSSLSNVPKEIASLISDSTFYSMFLVQGFVIYIIPTFGPIVNVLLGCWLYSLYCFEYKWSNWNLTKRIKFIEENWSYFFGFGITCAAPFIGSSLKAGFWISYAVWWLLFPFFIITAIGANTKHIIPHEKPLRVCLFRSAQLLNKFVLDWGVWLWFSLFKTNESN